MLHGDQQAMYTGMDSILDADYNNPNNAAHVYAQEYLNSLNPPGLASFRLQLKVGQPVILIRNIDPKRGLCNGTSLIVRGFGRKHVDCEILLGGFRGKRVFLPRIPLTTTDDGTTPVPIKPAFAMTINKSQGQTLKAVGLSPSTSVHPWPTLCWFIAVY
jgi:ATP-dependent DNA helicase PIF1